MMMNIKQIKTKYTCLDYLGTDAIVRQGVNGYLCRCPWREDKHPSLSISANGKGWIDHTTGEHGNIIDLVAKCIGTTDFARICEEFERKSFVFPFPPSKNLDLGKGKNSPFSVFSVCPLQSKGLFDYLVQRCIDTTIAQGLCSEVHYSFSATENNKYLYALAFGNDKGGFEVRSACFKGSKAPKGITTRIFDKNAPYVVFEGFMDMLSFATLCKCVKHNYIVLNSVVNVGVAIESLEKTTNTIYLLLDNDQAGNDTTKRMIEALPNAIDIRHKIAPHKDVNDYLVFLSKG